MITFSFPPSSHQPLSPHFVVHGRKASPDRPSGLPPFLRYLSFFSFIWRDSRRHRPRAICPSFRPSLGRPRCALTTPFIHFHPRNHPQRERGLEAASSVLRPPLILACIIKQVPQSQTAAAHCTADDGDGDVTDGVRIAVYRILRNQSWMSSPFCGGDVGAEQDSGRLAGCFGMLIADLSTSSCYLLLPFPKT